jgi:hypothetical protein
MAGASTGFGADERDGTFIDSVATVRTIAAAPITARIVPWRIADRLPAWMRSGRRTAAVVNFD